MGDMGRVAFCTACEEVVTVQWRDVQWRYGEHSCPQSGAVLPPGVFTSAVTPEEASRG